MTGLTRDQRADKERRERQKRVSAARERLTRCWTKQQFDAEDESLREEVARLVAAGRITIGPPCGWANPGHD